MKSRLSKRPRLTFQVGVYRSEKDLPDLLAAVQAFAERVSDRWEIECVFVVDGSPDRSEELLRRELPRMTGFSSQLLSFSRNFGGTYALQHGFRAGTGDYFSPLVPDLQEPLDVLLAAAETLRSGSADVVLGTNSTRKDPFVSKIYSALYWRFYRTFVNPQAPPRGIGFFVVTRRVRDKLVALDTRNAFIFGELLWLGYRRVIQQYERRARKQGKSSWSFTKKLGYSMDGIFYASLWPLRLFTIVGMLGAMASCILVCRVVYARLQGGVPVSGYTTLVTLITMFGSLSVAGIGLIGEYVGRILLNVQHRPTAIVTDHLRFDPAGARESAPVKRAAR